MKIQNIVSDFRKRVETAGKNYQGAFKAYVSAQSKAVTVVTHNSQSLAQTEIGAAKNIFASAKSSFERARADGPRQVANDPQRYVPRSRAQIVSAYKTTIDLLFKTGSELSDVVTTGYKSVVDTLSGQSASEQPGKNKASTVASSAQAAPGTAQKAVPATSASRAKPASTPKKTPSSRAKTASAAKTSTAKTSASGKSSQTKATTTRKKTATKKTAAASNNTGSTTAS